MNYHAVVPVKFCGAPAPSTEQFAAAARLAKHEADQGAGCTANTVTVKTYFHVVAASKDEKDGYLSNEALEDQLRVLNANYAPSNCRLTSSWDRYRA